MSTQTRAILDGTDCYETIRAAAIDVAELAQEWPVPAGNTEAVARIAERLSEDLAEVAAYLRRHQMKLNS